LKSLAAEFAGEAGTEPSEAPKRKQKLSLNDLSLNGVKDPHMKKTLKLLSREQKEKVPGAGKKLDVPLAKRAQDKQTRHAAYEKTNETLERWTESVKHNRRAEHLVFPLPQNLPSTGLDRHTLRKYAPQTESERLIWAALEERGLTPKPNKPKQKADGDDGLVPSHASIQAQRNEARLKRELHSREAKRAQRIKRIKSKAYHRVHRKAREREEVAIREAMEATGEIDSDEEREAQDRKRALERVGARHRDSKWAKSNSKTKRAVWDDDYRSGLHEMTQMNEELRRRKEGRTDGAGSDEDDEDSDDSGGSEDSGARLRRQLNKAAAMNDTPPESKIGQMGFMRRGSRQRTMR
jgi:U3 small nucleolar RNA-associated protein 14